MGTFDGVPGTFECRTAIGCQVTVRPGVDASVPNRFVSDTTEAETGITWRFTADDAHAMVDTSRMDGDYLTMGFWLEEPDNSRGTYNYSPFYAGRDAFNPTNLAPAILVGTATYAGPAVGKYAIREFRSEEASKGIFTADASLTANFSDAAVGTLGPEMIKGSVTNFVSADHDLGNWRVNLSASPVVNTDGDDASAGLISGTPEGDTDANNLGASITGAANGRDFTEGVWSGQFFGNHPRIATVHPTSVAGRFEASWGTPEPDVSTGIDTGGGSKYNAAEIGFVGLSGVFGAERTE